MPHDMASPPDPASPGFAMRRAAARKELDAIDPAMHGRIAEDPRRRTWFNEVYARAADDPARVPWADLAPHPLTKAFVDAQLAGLAGVRALDVACGLGDNAEYLAAAGADVAAFDFVPQAIDWARRRFPQSRVDYRVADLFALPADWRGAFDLVHECYTLQALVPYSLADAMAALAAMLAPGGRLLLVARARDEAAGGAGPPWLLPPSIFALAKQHGLEPVVIEDIAATAEIDRRHWRAVLRRAGAA
jgi:2-polyprenyl-3-methyl-5-hydroxy-6-metoxy-1,4-benzoquinol methylase